MADSIGAAQNKKAKWTLSSNHQKQLAALFGGTIEKDSELKTHTVDGSELKGEGFKLTFNVEVTLPISAKQVEDYVPYLDVYKNKLDDDQHDKTSESVLDAVVRKRPSLSMNSALKTLADKLELPTEGGFKD